MFLSIITATYNRAYCLSNIYISLLTNQRDLFEWIIVDDGSTDNTLDLVSEWIKEDKINLKYLKQENRGKTSAIIKGFSNSPLGKYALVLDSDDYLVGGIIEKLYFESLGLISSTIGMVGLKSNLDDVLIGTEFTSSFSNYIDLYFGESKILGDKLFIIRTNIYDKSFIEPFDGEKFVPDNVPYINANKFCEGELKCLNYVIYKGDYLEDGMTANVLNMAAKNINGFILEKKMLQIENLPFFEKIKNEVKYIVYSFSANRSVFSILRESNNKVLTFIMLMPSYVVAWRRIKTIRKLRTEDSKMNAKC